MHFSGIIGYFLKEEVPRQEEKTGEKKEKVWAMPKRKDRKSKFVCSSCQKSYCSQFRAIFCDVERKTKR